MAGSPVRVIILPGNGCTPIRECNWYGWLEEQLKAEPGVEVLMSDMPDPFVARENVWLPFVQRSWAPDERTVVIGHSSGAEAAMRLAETTKLLGIVLVSACHTDLGISNERASGYYARPWLWEDIRENVGRIVQFGAKDDPFLPLKEQQHVADSLRAEFHRLDGRGHFMEDEMPELMDVVRSFVAEAVPLVDAGAGGGSAVATAEDA